MLPKALLGRGGAAVMPPTSPVLVPPPAAVTQVWNVQQSGALGAIVVHDEDSLATMEVPENATLEYLT